MLYFHIWWDMLSKKSTQTHTYIDANIQDSPDINLTCNASCKQKIRLYFIFLIDNIIVSSHQWKPYCMCCVILPKWYVIKENWKTRGSNVSTPVYCGGCAITLFSRSIKIVRFVYTIVIALIFCRYICNTTADAPVKFQSNTRIWYTIVASSSNQ